MNTDNRYHQLDALRGIAALAVVVGHLSKMPAADWLNRSPLKLIGGGHAAVILFFVLSGFVLNLQFETQSRPSYLAYFVKRICRIYLPYLAVVTIAYGLYVPLEQRNVPWGGWLNEFWRHGLTLHQFMQHVYFLMPFTTNDLDPALWSLVYEMRISLIFPIIYIAAKRLAGWQLLISAALLVGIPMFYASRTGTVLIHASLLGQWMPTLHYAGMFLLGALLCQHRRGIENTLKKQRSSLAAWTFFLSSYCVYMAGRPLVARVAHNETLAAYVLDWVLAIGVAGIIISALNLDLFRRLLLTGPLKFLGKISYSLYLTHAVVILAVIHMLATMSQGVALFVSALLIIPVSVAGYHLLEAPSITLGRLIASALRQQRRAVVSDGHSEAA